MCLALQAALMGGLDVLINNGMPPLLSEPHIVLLQFLAAATCA